jgi:glutaredoxin
MRMIEPFELEKFDFEVARPVSSVPPAPPGPPFQPAFQAAYPVALTRRCHKDGLELNAFGDCGRCMRENELAAARRERHRWIAVGLAVLALVGLASFGFWMHKADERAAREAAVAISSRNKDKITVYTMTSCGACRIARAYLDSHDIPYQERPIDSDASAMLEIDRLKSGTIMVPTFVVGDEVITGFDPSGLTLERALSKHGIKKRPPQSEPAQE